MRDPVSDPVSDPFGDSVCQAGKVCADNQADLAPTMMLRLRTRKRRHYS